MTKQREKLEQAILNAQTVLDDAMRELKYLTDQVVHQIKKVNRAREKVYANRYKLRELEGFK